MALEREKNRLVLDKCQSILTSLLKDEDNKYCVDCDAKSPRWASWNIGIFLCIRCAGIHRNLGVHISKVKSVNLDSWTPQQVACIQQMGNSRARAVYEANLQDNFRRPQTDSSLEQFIRAKYEAKKYIAREWVPPGLPNPSWDLEIEKQLKKKKEKKSVTGTVEFPVKTNSTKSSGVSPKPLPKAPGGRNSSPNQSKRSPTLQKDTDKQTSSGTLDLLGLDAPSPSTTTNGTGDTDADIFGDFLTAPSALSSAPNKVESSESVQNDESNFFNQKLPDAASAEKMSRDSILALYNQTPAAQPPSQPTQHNVYVGGGMMMGGTAMPLGATLPAMPNAQLQHQQQLQQLQQQKLLQQQFQQQQLQQPPPQQQQSNMMFFPQQGPSIGGMGGPFYPPGAMGGGVIPPGMVPQHPLGAGPPGVQISAANPFAQMQAQMGNLNFGGVTPSQPQATPFMGNPPPSTIGNLVVTNHGLKPNHLQPTTLSTNLWQ